MLLVGPCRPDKIELRRAGALAWNSYWLDDANMPEKDGQLPASGGWAIART